MRICGASVVIAGVEPRPRHNTPARPRDPAYARFASFGGFKSAEALSAKAESGDPGTKRAALHVALGPRFRGDERRISRRRRFSRFNFQTAQHGIAPPPCFFAAPGTPSCGWERSARPEKNRGRAGRQGSQWTHGPRRLATSRLVECRWVPAVAIASFGQAHRKSAKPKASRARCLNRLAPRRSPAVGRLCAVRLLLPLRTRPLGQDASDGPPAVPAVRALDAYVERAGSFAAWTAGWEVRAASPTPQSRPPLPAPRLETLIRHPSVTRAG
jgi:hypothetical protein